jgi:hypothetical protein
MQVQQQQQQQNPFPNLQPPSTTGCRLQEVTHGCDRLAMSQHDGLLSHKVDVSEFVPQPFCQSQLKLESSMITWMLDERRKQERVLPATPLTWISPMHGSRSRSAAARSMTSPLAPAVQSRGEPQLPSALQVVVSGKYL